MENIERNRRIAEQAEYKKLIENDSERLGERASDEFYGNYLIRRHPDPKQENRIVRVYERDGKFFTLEPAPISGDVLVKMDQTDFIKQEQVVEDDDRPIGQTPTGLPMYQADDPRKSIGY